MCCEVWMRDLGRTLSGQGELADLVNGYKHLSKRRDYGRRDPNWREECLCPINVQATLERAGYCVINGWENDGHCDWIAWEPGYQARKDRERYDKAMAEMNSAKDATP